MPNKKAPSVEEAKALFLESPNKLLKEWSKEWGVSVERVRQLKVQAGLSIGNDIDYEVAEQVIQRIQSGYGTITTRKTYKGLPVGYDKFRTWCFKDVELSKRVEQARENFLNGSYNPTEKVCYKCSVNKSISEYDKSAKYKDGYNRYCKVCHSDIKENKTKIDKKTCMMCKQSLSPSSFDSNSKFRDGLSLFCKTCKSKERRKTRRINENLGI
jgi:hypothetical protein